VFVERYTIFGGAFNTEDVKILWFLEQCEKEGYSLGKAIAELKLVVSSEL
jgi:hypothetical protein